MKVLSFSEKVLEIVKAIPKGRVLSYAQVAGLAGNPKASRAVGTLMAKNQDKKVPCHQIIKSDGSMGMYNGLCGKNKQEVLEKKRVLFSKNGKVKLH